MHFRKKGFSLTEIVVIMVIIGVILVLELTIMQNRKNQYGAPYYAAYNALKKASYNILADIYCPDSGEGAICPNGPRPYPTDSKDMCLRLKEFINVSKDDIGSCEATSINKKADNFYDKNGSDEGALRFIGSNSFRFYISDMQTKTHKSEIANPATGELEEVTDIIEYFIVYVDINGQNKPNRINMQKDDAIYPDIVPFILTRRGETIPAGYPIYSKTYLTAKVKYPEKSDKDSTLKDHSGSMTFYEARTKAWGKNALDERQDIPMGVSYDTELKNNAEAATFYFNDEKDLETFQDSFNVDIAEASEKHPNRTCKPQTYNCKVIIDAGAESRY